MSTNLYVSTSAAVSRLSQLEILANNLANSDTTGFKADRPLFEATLESAILDTQGNPAPGAPGLSFVGQSGVRTDHTGGSVWHTGRPLDVAIEGPGFFLVDTPAGARYTRAGSFVVDAEGNLATPAGYPVLGEGGPIAVGDRPVRILAGGQVSDDENKLVGQLRLEEFDDPSLLSKEGDGLFLAPPLAVGLPMERISLAEGALERSNVQPVRELASLIILQRAFDVSMKILRSDDAATERLLQEVSR
jgi:flagellar basal-body rod protein FlgG